MVSAKTGDTVNSASAIYAPATPLLPSAVTIVRVSGRGLGEELAPLLTLPPPRVATLRRLEWDGFSEKALVLYFPAPRSYTGEDVVEFHLHGNPLLVKRFMELLDKMGSRPAEPGEFTLRALLNGRQDLLGVEALHDLMAADTDTGLRQAQARAGGAPPWLNRARGEIALWAARAEASVDYGEEEGLGLDLCGLKAAAMELEDMFHVERAKSRSAGWLRDGVRVAIAGPPNAGKSTLFNALAGEERAIVSEVPGTTRDVLETRCELGGLPLLLYDTAGLRETDDAVERMGVARAAAAFERADIVLFLSPADEGWAGVPRGLGVHPSKTMLVRSKADLAADDGAGGVRVSAAQGDLSALAAALEEMFLGRHTQDDCLGALATERQRALLAELAHQMGLIAGLPDACPAELPSSLLQGALGLLARLTGEDRAGLALDAMFSSFCFGK